MRYLHPFRIYLLASVLFFLIISIEAQLPYLPAKMAGISLFYLVSFGIFFLIAAAITGLGAVMNGLIV